VTTEVVRANIPARGISPAQWGFRANDAAGNPIFDSLGLIAVMNVLGSITNISSGSQTGNGSWQTVGSTTVSFTLSRATSVLALAYMTLDDPTVGDTGYVLNGTVLIDGALDTSASPVFFIPNAPGAALTLFAVKAFSSGSHSVALGVQQTNTHLWAVVGAYLYAFQLGN